MQTKHATVELKANSKNNNPEQDIICQLCKKADDTTEHLFECEKIQQKMGNIPSINMLSSEKKENQVELVKFLTKICQLKGIDSTKKVKENLEKKEEKYKVKSLNGLKLVLEKNKKGKENLEKKEKKYEVKSSNGLKLVLKKTTD